MNSFNHHRSPVYTTNRQKVGDGLDHRWYRWCINTHHRAGIYQGLKAGNICTDHHVRKAQVTRDKSFRKPSTLREESTILNSFQGRQSLNHEKKMMQQQATTWDVIASHTKQRLTQANCGWYTGPGLCIQVDHSGTNLGQVLREFETELLCDYRNVAVVEQFKRDLNQTVPCRQKNFNQLLDEKIFSEKTIDWSKIVMVAVIVAALAERALSFSHTWEVKEYLIWSRDYFRHYFIDAWIEAKGGWEVLVQLKNSSQNPAQTQRQQDNDVFMEPSSYPVNEQGNADAPNIDFSATEQEIPNEGREENNDIRVKGNISTAPSAPQPQQPQLPPEVALSSPVRGGAFTPTPVRQEVSMPAPRIMQDQLMVRPAKYDSSIPGPVRTDMSMRQPARLDYSMPNPARIEQSMLVGGASHMVGSGVASKQHGTGMVSQQQCIGGNSHLQAVGFVSQQQHNGGQGQQQSQQGFNAVSQQQGFDIASQQQGINAASQQQGFGQASKQQDFSIPSQQKGFDQASKQQDFASPSQQPSFNQGSQQQGFGAASQQQQGINMPKSQQQGLIQASQQQGFSQPSLQQGLSQPSQQQAFSQPGQQQGFTIPSQQGVNMTKNQSQGFGAASQQQQGFGAASQQQQGINMPKSQQQGFSQLSQQQGLSQFSQQQGFSQPSQQQGMSQPSQQQGSSQPSQQQGFSQPSQQQGHSQPSQQQAFSQPGQQQGFSQPSQQQGFSQPSQQQDSTIPSQQGVNMTKNQSQGFGASSQQQHSFGAASQQQQGISMPKSQQQAFSQVSQKQDFAMSSQQQVVNTSSNQQQRIGAASQEQGVNLSQSQQQDFGQPIATSSKPEQDPAAEIDLLIKDILSEPAIDETISGSLLNLQKDISRTAARSGVKYVVTTPSEADGNGPSTRLTQSSKGLPRVEPDTCCPVHGVELKKSDVSQLGAPSPSKLKQTVSQSSTKSTTDNSSSQVKPTIVKSSQLRMAKSEADRFTEEGTQIPEEELSQDPIKNLKKEVNVFKDFAEELENSSIWRIKIKLGSR